MVKNAKSKSKGGKASRHKKKYEKVGLRGLVNDTAIRKGLRDEARESLNFPTEETERKGLYVERITKEGKRRAHNLAECNLDIYLRRRGSITNEQHAAGMRLYKDFYASGMIKGFKSCLNVTIGGRGGVDKSGILNFQAYESFRSAVDSIPGKRAQQLVIRVCCVGEWLKDIVNLRIAEHKRMDILQRGLDELVRHYAAQMNPKRILESFNKSMHQAYPDGV